MPMDLEKYVFKTMQTPKSRGVDFDSAKKLGLNVIWALSLPGKVAPVTAAVFIKETIYNIINELGV